MKSTWMMTLYLSSFGLLFSTLVRAQVCELTNASLISSYGFVASEGGTVVTTTSTTGTGTTGATSTGTTGTSSYSNTQIGQLLGGISAGNQFADSGVLAFDGAGDVFATAAPASAAVAKVGTYKVNSDCSITVSLTDAFGTNTTAIQLVGVILGRGAEIDLTSAASVQSQIGTGSTSTPTAGSGTSTTTTTTTSTPSGLVVKLVRLLYQNGCSDSTLKGRYGFVLTPMSVQAVGSTTGTTTGTGTSTGTGTGATGTTTTTGTTDQPSAVLGYIYFDGAGNIVSTLPMTATTSTTSSSSTTGQSSYSALQFTGTYSVNLNCTGTMTISNSSTSSTTGTSTGTSTGSTSTTSNGTQSIALNFVISPPSGSVGGAQTPALSLSYSTADESGSGYALGE